MSTTNDTGAAVAARGAQASTGVLPGGGRRSGADRRGRIRRHQLPIFFALAFGLSWLPWPLVLLNPTSSPMVPFGPLLAAIITALISGGLRSVAGLLGPLRYWRASPRRYLVAMLVPVLATLSAAAMAVVSGGTITTRAVIDWAQVVSVFAATLVLVGLFEEVGWRGYALPALQPTLGGLPAALVLGLVWVLWHLPLLMTDPTQQRPIIPFLLLVVAQSLFFSWLYNSHRVGLVLVILSHAAVDTVARYVLPQFAGDDYLLVWWWQTAFWLLVGLFAATRLVRIRPVRS